MTLTADRGALGPAGESDDRRRHAYEPRRSWASQAPFEHRVTSYNTGPATVQSWRVRRLRYAAVTVVLDAFAAATSFGLLLATVNGAGARLGVAAACGLGFVVLVAVCGGYDWSRLGDGPEEFQALLRAGLFGAALLLATAFAIGREVPRSLVFVGIPSIVVLGMLTRHAQRRRLHVQRQHGLSMRSTILVGDVPSARRVIHDLAGAPHHGYRVDGVCLGSVDVADSVADVPVVGAIADVVQVVADRAAEVVVVTGSCVSGEALRRLSWALGRAGARMVVVPDIVEVARPRLTVRPTAGLSLLDVELDAPRRRLVAKSVLDVTLASVVGLLVAPIVLVAAVLIRLTSAGSPFYAQTRIGVDGQPFTLWKLRTMYVDADARRAELMSSSEGAGPLFKMHRDPRVTPVGRILRRYSVDELPQLWNVVRGDMSLVGPRPSLATEVEAYADEVHRRFRVKPGLTGLWQVSGRSNLAWDESVRLDLRYVDNWSVAMDLLILWKTGRAVVRGQGAY